MGSYSHMREFIIIIMLFLFLFCVIHQSCLRVLTSQDHSSVLCFKHNPAKLNNLNFQPLEVVSRYRDPQLQGAENY